MAGCSPHGPRRGIVGPVVVNYLHDTRYSAGIAPDQLYGQIFYILAGMLVVGFIANLLIRPVDPKWHMSEAEVAAEQAELSHATTVATTGSFGIGKGGLDAKAILFWSLVGVPLAWGVWQTAAKALVLFNNDPGAFLSPRGGALMRISTIVHRLRVCGRRRGER